MGTYTCTEEKFSKIGHMTVVQRWTGMQRFKKCWWKQIPGIPLQLQELYKGRSLSYYVYTRNSFVSRTRLPCTCISVLSRTRDMTMLAIRKEMARRTKLSNFSLTIILVSVPTNTLLITAMIKYMEKMALMVVMDTCTSSIRSEQWLPLLKLHISCMVVWITSMLKLRIICTDDEEIMVGCCWPAF